MNAKLLATIVSASIVITGCSAVGHKNAVRNDDKDRISVGKVQKEIKVGMSSAEVAGSLGSPNMVTTDEHRREEWVYDKIATESVHSSSSGGISTLILGGIGRVVAGGFGPSYSKSAGASSTSQRTLTVIVKFDKESRVRDFSYRTSSF